MFIYSVRAAKLKAVLIFLACAAVVTLVVFAASRRAGVYPGDVLTDVRTADPSSYEGIRTQEDRISFLSSRGWKVEEEPVKILQVKVPSVFDAVYDRYNQIQIAQGLDLSPYKGKDARLYTYVVTNYDYEGTVWADLLVRDGRIIAADLCSADVNGFMHGLDKNNDILGPAK